MRHIWVDGAYTNWDDATTHFWSETAIRGVSAFEGVICPWIDGSHYALALPEHHRRLQRSCSLIGVANPLTTEALIGLLIDAAKHFPEQSFYARPTVFVRSGRGTADSRLGHFMGAFDAEITPSLEVCSAQIAGQPRIGGVVPPDAKTGGSYLDFRVIGSELDADVQLYVDRDGYLTEADGAGLLLVTDDGIVVPPTSGRALDSVTRRLLVLLAEQAGIHTLRELAHRSAAHGAVLITAGTLNGIRVATLRESLVPARPEHLALAQRLSMSYHDAYIRHVCPTAHTPLTESRA